MKSKRVEEYINTRTKPAEELPATGIGSFAVQVVPAIHAIEIAEEEMAKEAGRPFEQFMSGVFQGDTLKKMAEEFKQKLMEE